MVLASIFHNYLIKDVGSQLVSETQEPDFIVNFNIFVTIKS